MKKIFTLLFAVGIVSIASAQSRDFGYSKPNSGYSVNKKSVIQQINREFDYKIAAVNMNRRMSRWEKSKQIRNLENQRDAAIRRAQFSIDRDNHAYSNDRFHKDNSHKW